MTVCKNWKRIALSIPALWGAFQIISPCSERLLTVVQRWIQRAKNRPLSIFLSGPPDEEVSNLIQLHSQRVNQLDLSILAHPEQDYDQYYHLLAGMEAGTLSSLRVLRLDGGWRDAFGWITIHGFLRCAPNLVDCVFENILTEEYMYPVDELVLPNMRRLGFFDSLRPPVLAEACSTSDEILQFITAPGLVALTLPMNEIATKDLLAFLQRSSPQLRELSLEYGDHIHRDPTHLSHLHDCLLHIPTL
ncbi:hypothetical protein FB45DRAFT_1000193, partial [Roridomyces roridus]